MSDSWILLTPRLARRSSSWRFFVSCVRSLSRMKAEDKSFGLALERLRDRGAQQVGARAQVLRVLISALCDLKVQGWSFRVARKRCWASQPIRLLDSPLAEKARVRAGHLIE